MRVTIPQEQRFRWAFVLPALAALAVILVAASSCGGDSEPTIEIVIEADLASLPPGMDAEEAMNLVAEVVERRVELLGFDGRVTKNGPDHIAVELSGANDIFLSEVVDVIGRTARLEFREPVINEQNLVVCDSFIGSTGFAVFGNMVRDGVCTGSDADRKTVTGSPQWLPATARDSNGDLRVLTGAFVNPGGADLVVLEGVQCTPACVVLDFTDEGSLLFEEITSRLVNFPLGIFLDEDLIGAPNVASVISGGDGVIGGLQRGDAETLAIQINAGSLPVQIDVVDVYTNGGRRPY